MSADDLFNAFLAEIETISADQETSTPVQPENKPVC